MCEIGAPIHLPADITDRNQHIVRNAIKTAGWAPFHFNRNINGIAEPWRAHILWHDEAYKLAVYLRDELKVSNKEPLLLAGCNALVLVTWLPEFYDAEAQDTSYCSREIQITRDEEHLAATSAMVQNLLLLLTAHKMGTYWSSGAKLREPAILKKLGTEAGERLIAAVFIEYPEMMSEHKTRKIGSQRNNRSEHWIHEVST